MVVSNSFGIFTPLICEEVHLIGGLGGVIFLKDIFLNTIFTPSKIRANKFDFIPTLRGCDSPPSFCINIMKLGNPLKIAPLCTVLFFLRPENGAVSFLERFCFLNDLIIPPRLDFSVSFLLDMWYLYIVYPRPR